MQQKPSVSNEPLTDEVCLDEYERGLPKLGIHKVLATLPRGRKKRLMLCLPNHLSIGIVDPGGRPDGFAALHIIGSNREQVIKKPETALSLARWAEDSWNERFKTYAPDVLDLTDKAQKRLMTERERPRRQEEDLGCSLLRVVEEWHQEAKTEKEGQECEAKVFQHPQISSVVTFKLHKGFQVHGPCLKDRMLFDFCRRAKNTDNEQPPIGIFGNTCSEALLHLLYTEAVRQPLSSKRGIARL